MSIDLDTIKKLAHASYCGDRSSEVIGDDGEVALLNMIPDMIAELEAFRSAQLASDAPTDVEAAHEIKRLETLVDVLRAESEQQRVWLANCHSDKARYSAIIDRQREVIKGRTTAPTDAEIDAHAAVGGKWWVFAQWHRGGAEKSANIIQSWAPGVARYLRDGQPDARWWALDASWAPCAWPEVSNAG